jgi:hypothetical protein
MKKGALVFLIYSAITIALTYPLIVQMGSVLPHDAGDPALNTWILWWNTRAVPLTAAWWNAPAFFPAPGVLSFSENLLGLSLISTPLYWLGVGPPAAYNVVFLLTFPLSALGAYLLVYELTGRRDAAFIGGLLFGFAPYRIAHIPQIQTLASFPMPYALLGLHRYLRDPRPQWLALFGAGWLLQALCNGYYLLFFSVFVALWVLWFASPWSRRREFLAIAVTSMIAAMPVLPLLLRYRAFHTSFGFERDLRTIREFSADVASLLHVSSDIALWGWIDVFRRAEGELFPGLTIAMLVLAGAIFARDRSAARVNNWVLARRILIVLTIATSLVALSAAVIGPWRLNPLGVPLISVSTPVKPLTLSVVLALGLGLTSPALRRTYATRAVLPFYAMSGFLMWLFSLGPAPTLMGDALMYRGPYSLLMYLPGFSTLRVPARFWMMVTLCLAVIGGVVFARLTEKLGRLRIAATVVVVIGVLADTWMAPMPVAETPKPFQALSCSGAGSGPLIELPLGDTYPDVAAMYRQMSHQRPLINGFSGFFPPQYLVLRTGLRRRDQDVLTHLGVLGVTDIVVDREPDPEGDWNKYVESHPAATHVCTIGKQSLYRIAPAERDSNERASGSSLRAAVIRTNVNPDIAPLMIDRDLATRWHSGPQETGMRVDIDLGSVQMVQGIDLSLARAVEDFPREMVIETSEDGQRWREQWRGTSAGRAVIAAIDISASTPMRYRFAPTRAQIIRMRLTTGDEIYYWSIAEITVIGP